MPDAVIVFQKAKLLFAPGKAANAGGVATSGLEMSQNSLRLSWTSEEDQKLKEIMLNIHSSCVKYGSDSNGYVDYVKGQNIAGFVKWLTLCLLKVVNLLNKLNAFYHSDILD
jgi:glutamate dehydrogenase (NADP+)